MRHGRVVYLVFAITAMFGFAALTARSSASVATTGPDDPSHAVSAGIPANIQEAASINAGFNTLKGPLKAVKDTSGGPSEHPLWIVYAKSESGPPPRFGPFDNVAVAVDGVTGAQVTSNSGISIPQQAPFSRLGASGAWLYLGFGLGPDTLTAIEAIQVVELATILAWAWSRRRRIISKGEPASSCLAKMLWGVLIVLTVPTQIFAIWILAVLASWGDPISSIAVWLWPTILVIALIVARALVAPKSVQWLRN